MKKWMIFPVLLMLLLTACQPVPDSESEPTGSTPSSSSITPPSSSVVLPTSTPATSIPATEPPKPANTGYAHIYEGDYPWLSVDPDFSGCTPGHLYWIDIATSKVTSIAEEAVQSVVQEGAYVYYVKAAEPTKIYRTLIGEFSQHELIHETTHGAVDAMIIYYTMENYLQYVASGQKFIIFDLNTCEETVLMEQYYLDSAYIQKERDGAMSDYILFTGQPTEDSPYTDYSYNRITGEVAIEDYGDCDCDECV